MKQTIPVCPKGNQGGGGRDLVVWIFFFKLGQTHFEFYTTLTSADADKAATDARELRQDPRTAITKWEMLL